jgi:hypothetical protein
MHRHRLPRATHSDLEHSMRALLSSGSGGQEALEQVLAALCLFSRLRLPLSARPSLASGEHLLEGVRIQDQLRRVPLEGGTRAGHTAHAVTNQPCPLFAHSSRSAPPPARAPGNASTLGRHRSWALPRTLFEKSVKNRRRDRPKEKKQKISQEDSLAMHDAFSP